MKKIYRVKKEKEYQRVFHQGKSIANRQVVVYVYPKPGQDHFRVGLSVSKKLGNAVVRNQIKRYLRQALHELEAAIKPDIDFLLIARQDIRGRSVEQVKESLIHVMKLVNIIDVTQIKQSPGGQHAKKSK